jgi:hypothetical protein
MPTPTARIGETSMVRGPAPEATTATVLHAAGHRGPRRTGLPGALS